MIGRYGADQLMVALVALSVGFLLLSRLTRLGLFYLVALALLAYAYFRMLSRDAARRAEENRRFLRFWGPVSSKLRGAGETLRDSRSHCHFKCPNCGQKVRVPRGRGKVSITCPSCRREFIRKT